MVLRADGGHAQADSRRLNLRASSDCGRDAELEFSDYPGEYMRQGDGQKVAALRAEEFEASRILAVGQSTSPRFAPGLIFELIEHPADLNGSYMLTSVSHQGRQSTTRTTASQNGRNGVLDARLHQSLMAARRSEDARIRELAEALLQTVSKPKGGDPTANRALTLAIPRRAGFPRFLRYRRGVWGQSAGSLVDPELA